MRETDEVPEDLHLFCAQLRDLRQLSGMPSLDAFCRAMPMSPGKSTLSESLNGKIRRAPRWELVAELARACVQHASRSGRQVAGEALRRARVAQEA